MSILSSSPSFTSISFFCWSKGCEDSRFVHGVRGVRGRCATYPHPLTPHPQRRKKHSVWMQGGHMSCKLCSPREGRHSARPTLHGTKKNTVGNESQRRRRLTHFLVGDTVISNSLHHDRVHALIFMPRDRRPLSSDTLTSCTFINFSGDRDFVTCVSPQGANMHVHNGSPIQFPIDAACFVTTFVLVHTHMCPSPVRPDQLVGEMFDGCP